MIYKLIKNKMTSNDCGVICNNADGSITSFLFDPANTDYQNFKKQILADEAQLQDADGNVMTDAKAYVASLP